MPVEVAASEELGEAHKLQVLEQVQGSENSVSMTTGERRASCFAPACRNSPSPPSPCGRGPPHLFSELPLALALL